jgi:hypothetical protein
MARVTHLSDFSVLILPGLEGSGPEHWQTYWERAFPEFRRVEQDDWGRPVYDAWSSRLTDAVTQCVRPAVLVAHSLGTALATRWAFDQPAAALKIAGALLVAPSDQDRPDVAASPARGFAPMVLRRLPYPSALIASRDDNRVSFERAREFAGAWGSTFFDAGHLGHMGTAAKPGLWPQGLVCFGRFLGSL